MVHIPPYIESTVPMVLDTYNNSALTGALTIALKIPHMAQTKLTNIWRDQVGTDFFLYGEIIPVDTAAEKLHGVSHRLEISRASVVYVSI